MSKMHPDPIMCNSLTRQQIDHFLSIKNNAIPFFAPIGSPLAQQAVVPLISLSCRMAAKGRYKGFRESFYIFFFGLMNESFIPDSPDDTVFCGELALIMA
jgi:hypothetical protein